MYTGMPIISAMRMARLVASPSTSGGRDAGCPSGPVMPLSKICCCRCEMISPFSAWMVAMQPSSAQLEKELTGSRRPP